MAVAAAVPTAVLDAAQLSAALRAGIYRLFTVTDHLNKINVFPVPDGDTGTNMSMTCAAMLGILDAQPEPGAGALLVRVADAALDGARGNSGAILAQFMQGLADATEHLPVISIPEWLAALRSATDYARGALNEPREGTILTLIQELALASDAARTAGNDENWRDLHAAVLPRLEAALAATRDGLPEMRSANVVDAGAAGFVAIIAGMAHYYSTGETGDRPVLDYTMHSEQAPAAAFDGHYQYCAECIVTGVAIDQRRLREELSAQGASLVVAGSNRKTRVHLHTNDPQSLFATVERYGAVSGQKADDMLAQQHAAHHGHTQRVVIVTDSAADLPDDALERLDLHVVPMRVHFGSHSYLDKVTLTPAEFYRELAANPVHPQTSQPPPGDFRRLFEFLTSHFHDVVSICVSSRVSGTFNAAVTAAQRESTDRIRVIDSRTVSLGQGLLAMRAAECAKSGADLQTVMAAVDSARAATTTLALLPRLDYAVRGGRVPRLFKLLAKALRLAIVLGVRPDGRVTVTAAIWGRHRLIQRFADKLRRRMRPDRRYWVAVGHGDAEASGRELLQAIATTQPQVEAQHLLALGTALGVHGGPGTLVAAIMELERPLQPDDPRPSRRGNHPRDAADS